MKTSGIKQFYSNFIEFCSVRICSGYSKGCPSLSKTNQIPRLARWATGDTFNQAELHKKNIALISVIMSELLADGLKQFSVYVSPDKYLVANILKRFMLASGLF